MENSFTNVTKVGLGTRFINSLKGLVIGFILFVISIFTLYLNEGRVDMSVVAKEAVQISSQTINTGLADGQLVSVSGPFTSTEKFGDSLYLKDGVYLSIERVVEMYAWEENKKSNSTINTGGSETVETSYTYKKEWTVKPDSSESFVNPDGHFNPKKELDNYSKKALTANVGVYEFRPGQAILPTAQTLNLNAENTSVPTGGTLSGQYLYLAKEGVVANPSNPQVGDLRVSYRAVRPGFEGTIFGSASGNRIEPYQVKPNVNFYSVFDMGHEASIEKMRSNYNTMSWVLRSFGFAMMWFGLYLLLVPITTLMDILPFLGKASRWAVGFGTFIVAAILSLVIIVVSMIVHNLFALIITLVLVISAIIYYLKNKNREQTN